MIRDVGGHFGHHHTVCIVAAASFAVMINLTWHCIKIML